MQNPEHRYSVTILEQHLDTFGHMNNTTYLQIFEEARWDLITSNGYGLNRIQETGLGPVILEIHLKFRREILLRQRITIITKFLSYRRKIAILHQEIRDEQDRLCCEAEFTFALFDLKKRKLVIPTPEWLNALGLKTLPASS